MTLSKEFPTFRRNVTQDGECIVFLDCLTIENEGTRFPLNAMPAKYSVSNPTQKLWGSKFRTFQMYSLPVVFSMITKTKIIPSSLIRH